ncbi:MAG TPA: glycoside hydrolase family 19 protein [Methylophilaceae bacterium]|jgi:putative chitinase
MALNDWFPKLLADPQQLGGNIPFGADAAGQQNYVPGLLMDNVSPQPDGPTTWLGYPLSQLQPQNDYPNFMAVHGLLTDTPAVTLTPSPYPDVSPVLSSGSLANLGGNSDANAQVPIQATQDSSQLPVTLQSAAQQTFMPTALTNAKQVSMPNMVAAPPPQLAPQPFSNVTAEQIMKIMPSARASDVQRLLPHINAAMQKYDITTAPREAAFLAQVAQETGDLNYLEEIDNGTNYSKYEGSKKLGNTQPGDGARFRGRGLMQTSGRANYEETGKALGVDLINHPELLLTPKLAAASAAQYFQLRNLNELADKSDINAITKAVNGTNNGPQTNLSRRQQAYITGMKVLGN